MKFHCFNIYKELPKLDSRIVLIPELCEPIQDESFINGIAEKIIYNYGHIAYTDNLILKDKSLIEDMKLTDSYLIFLASNEMHDQSQWDVNLHLDELIFLGWTINYDSDSAAIDGIFPIVFDDVQANGTSNLKVIDEDALNEWGLIKNDLVCDKYIELNKKEVKHIIYNDETYQELIANWQAFGIYCDKYTYKKLIKLLKTEVLN